MARARVRGLIPRARLLAAQARRLTGFLPRSRRVGLALAVAGILALVVLASVAWFVADVAADLPDDEAIRGAARMAEATRVYDRRDRPAFSIYQERRIDVPLEAISPWLVSAILAIEDRRFYDHRGVDFIRVAGAAWANLRAGRAVQGASTITQQLARQSLLTGEKTIRRKVSEALLAARFEHHYSKREILRLYLNKVYFGDGLYGAEAASLGYFGVHAADLSLPDAALLAGLVKAPSAYAPTANPEGAVARRNVVLRAMLGAGAIDRATWAGAREEPVVLRNLLETGEAEGRHFKEHVRRQLVGLFGWERVYQGGLRVYTTLDPEMQRAAEASVRTSLEEIERRRARAAASRVATAGGAPQADDGPLQAAAVAIDPKTGEVRALVGGRESDAGGFNRAVQARRQPGSAFKPLVFARALESGFTPATLIEELDEPVLTAEGPWMPDDGHAGEGPEAMTLRMALRTSSNRAAVRLLDSVGIDDAIRYAGTVGITNLPRVPSLALGAGEVTLLDLTAAYVPFAAGGLLRRPVFIRRVEDANGTVLFASRPESSRVVSEATAFQMAQMLADVVDSGTGSAVRRRGFTLPAGGKTGTTNGFHDAWFVGFTPSLVSGVWIGFDRPRRIARRGYASDLAAPLWADFMKEATSGDGRRWLEVPPDVVAVQICRHSGKRPNAGCDSVRIETSDGKTTERSLVYTEYFKRGTAPVEVCELHPGRSFFERVVNAVLGDHRRGSPVEVRTAVGRRPPAADPDERDAAANAATREAGAAADPRTTPPEAGPEERPKKKRGFWARLFGVGKDDDGDTANKRKGEQKRQSG